MNKKERRAIADLIAYWEWTQGGGTSVSEAMGIAGCAAALRETVQISDDDLLFARTWQIIVHMDAIDDVDICDALDDLVEAKGYNAVVDIIEEKGFGGLREVLDAMVSGA